MNYVNKLRREQQKKFARIYSVYDMDGGKYEVRGYTLPFTLYAAGESTGVLSSNAVWGALPTEGFGMLDLAKLYAQPTYRAL